MNMDRDKVMDTDRATDRAKATARDNGKEDMVNSMDMVINNISIRKTTDQQQKTNH